MHDALRTKIIDLYNGVASVIEERLFNERYPTHLLDIYYALFREMESNLALFDSDDRFDFVIVTPVADRPRHLEHCLASLLQLCKHYGYGGIDNRRFKKVRVLVADDSKEPDNIEHNRSLACQYREAGLEVEHFGQRQQLKILHCLSEAQQVSLQGIVGTCTPDRFYHKGASITRNITYLRLQQISARRPRTLFWFLDSDQEFQVNVRTRRHPVFAINYFHRIDRIFSAPDIKVLTGKVVGDPPVSPAVMANTFLEDILSFLSSVSGVDPQGKCVFHAPPSSTRQHGSYHDMAELFGLDSTSRSFEYDCPLEKAHTNLGCFKDFSLRLNAFFDGQHPTRQTYFEHRDFESTIVPARTVYTGNYILAPQALQYFIPFATLKLRMAGPTLGRFLKSELGDGFVSANLPMLHKRTIDAIGRSEFRPGIDRGRERIDLSGEFERQFYGDVMLFSVERLVRDGYPHRTLNVGHILRTITQTEADLVNRYAKNRPQIRAKIERITTLLDDLEDGWLHEPSKVEIKHNFLRFIRNMEHNFGPHAEGYRLIHSDRHRRKRLDEILEAILQLPNEKEQWLEALSRYRQSEWQDTL